MLLYLGPLLLVVLGLAGLLVVVGRRLPEFRAALSSPPAVAPHAEGGLLPASSLTRSVSRTVLETLRAVGRVTRTVWRAAGRLLERPPVSVRIPRLAFRPPRGGVRGAWRSGAVALRERWHVRGRPAGVLGSGAADGSLAVESEPPTVFADVETSRGVPPPPPVRGQSSALPEPPPLAAAPSPGGPDVLAEELPGGSDAGAPEEAPEPAMLQTDVEEHTYRRRKVVGKVKPQKPETRSQRPESRDPVPVTGPPQAKTGDRKLDRPLRPAAPAPVRERSPSTLADVPRLLAAGDVSEAETILVEALAANPRDLTAYRLLGHLYVQRADFVQAKEVCEEALQRNPDDVTLYGLLGKVYVALGKYSQALQMYQRAHDADEANVEYLEQLLFLATRMDRRPLVRVTAEKILALQPNHADAKKHLAKALAR